MSNFLTLAIKGKIKNPDEEIDDFVEKWHKSKTNQSLSTFLGMTEKEYNIWVRNPKELKNIINSRK